MDLQIKPATKAINLNIPADLYKEIKHMAIDFDMSVKDMFLNAIKEYIGDLRDVKEGKKEVEVGAYQELV